MTPSQRDIAYIVLRDAIHNMPNANEKKHGMGLVDGQPMCGAGLTTTPREMNEAFLNRGDLHDMVDELLQAGWDFESSLQFTAKSFDPRIQAPEVPRYVQDYFDRKYQEERNQNNKGGNTPPAPPQKAPGF